MPKLILKNILVYSITNKGVFSTDFGSGVNIIHGRNTSGKSTLIQSILYTMGINDSKENLNEIIEQNTVFRLECEIMDNDLIKEVIFVRSDDTIIIHIDDTSPIRFDGINGNSSYEYVRYKELFNRLFDFKLKLQKQTDLTNAPIEAAFLPYYISQSVGWVYLRESIGDYRFYKDFKFDYLDYYTGIKDNTERLQKYNLQKDKKQLEYELNQLNNYKLNNKSFQITEMLEKRFKGESLSYLKNYDLLATTLAAEEANHGKLCNKLSMLRGRQKVILQTIRNLKLQKPRVDRCPTCEQTLPGDISDLYIYIQDLNDAVKEKDRVSLEIKKAASDLNSVEHKIRKSSEIINSEYNILKNSNIENISIDDWIDHHANIALIKNIESKQSEYNIQISSLQSAIDKLGNDLDINDLRNEIEKEFIGIFQIKAKSLGVRIPDNSKYRDLYSIISFPYQGVELHKIIMAYHFAFYHLVHKRSTIHKFPFLLDAILKEDIDVGSREIIFNFLKNEAKNKEQILFSIAEYKKDKNPEEGDPLFDINEINTLFFSGNAKQICIGDAKYVRSFLNKKELNVNEISLLDNAFSLLQTL